MFKINPIIKEALKTPLRDIQSKASIIYYNTIRDEWRADLVRNEAEKIITGINELIEILDKKY